MEEAFRLFKSTREYLTPVLAESAFLERGMLTPEEFVRAGDHLVRSSPSWSWESGEKSKLRPYLPPNKQFLVTRGVPSFQRVSVFNSAAFYTETAEEGGEGLDKEAWCFSEFNKNTPQVDEDIDFVEKEIAELALSTEKESGESAADIPPPPAPVAQKQAVVADYIDMEDDTLELDAATLKPVRTGSPATNEPVKVRRYDVSLTYDNYYRTPRVWLYGYDENGSALDPTATFEDVMQDYAKRTVTIDPHPHISRSDASIHPCQHGSAMLNILKALQESGATPTVDQYLYIFLKFIQSVVPTIEYDYTVDVQAN
jgi:ubiquitin-like-conjugating enzyme ATG3